MPTIEKIKILRDKTGAGMMDCKKALVETGGDVDKAVDFLRERGLSKAANKASRIAAEGLANVAIEGNTALIYEVNSETDFVSQNDEFIKLVDEVGAILIKSNATNTEEALAVNNPQERLTVEQMLLNMTAKIGEKITLRRVQRVTKKDDEVFGLYKHQGGKIIALTVVKGNDQEVAKNIAMHVTASKPRFLDRASVDQETVEHEKQVLTQQALNEGKPANIVEKMVIGRLNKFFEEICLTDQAYVKDTDMKVKQYLKSVNSQVTFFLRLEVGEGIEKREEDFAAEVAAQMNK
ncbi:MAG TPA: elongation factor Ts [Acholeplasmataceae bacterium]|jgi:elongation factor Ts|nr:elongation factor Ts [Acholeplasmataceae bacterium]